MSMDRTSQENPKLAAWFENLIMVCNVAMRRGFGIACHPSAKAPMMDFMERVLEDDLYNFDELPPLVVHSQVQPGEFQFIDDTTMKVISFQAAMKSGTGIGRFDKMYAPHESLKRMDR
jgi:hypothetical protein